MSHSSRPSVSIAAVAFAITLGLVECGTRHWERQLSTGEAAAYWPKRDAVRNKQFDVLIVGDSTAHEGIVPGELNVASAFNAALPSGSGIVAESITHSALCPNLLIYAGIPVEVADTWAPQRHERILMTLDQRLSWAPLSADLVLAGFSRFYGMHEQIETRMASVLQRRPLMSVSGEIDGWLPVPHCVVSQAKRDALAREKVKLWFTARPRGAVRRGALERTMSASLQSANRRMLIMMPLSSSIRRELAAHSPESSLVQTWLAVADSTDSALLDCRAAMPDEAFHDEDHLDQDGARIFSRGLAEIVRGSTTPFGCSRLR